MRVAFLVHQFPVVSETFIVNQAAGLLERGHDVEIFSLFRLDAASAANGREIAALRARLHEAPSRLESGRWGLLATDARSTLVRSLRHPVAMTRLLGAAAPVARLASLRQLHKVVPLFLRPAFDVLHCQFGTVAEPGMWLTRARRGRTRLVVSFRGYDISRHVRALGPDVYREVFAHADVCLANCEHFAVRLRELGCPADKIAVHRSGLDPARYPFRVLLPAAGEAVRILTVGRLVEKKGIADAIRATAQLVRRGLAVTHTIVGDGPLRDDLRRLIAREVPPGVVRMCGAQPPKRVLGELAAAHLFVAPSVTAGDGDQDAPLNVLKEAMAVGLPVVSTRHGGIPELVEDGRSGYLVAQGDAEAIADRLQRLIEQPGTWAAMATAARARVVERYDLNDWNDRLVATYERLLHERR